MMQKEQLTTTVDLGNHLDALQISEFQGYLKWRERTGGNTDEDASQAPHVGNLP